MSYTTIGFHSVASISIQPIEHLGETKSTIVRTITLTDTSGHRLEITAFGTDASLAVDLPSEAA